MQYAVALAGSTQRTAQVAATLFQDPRFTLALIVTPQPRKIGRKREIVKNPLHVFAETNDIPTLLVDTKITPELRQQIEGAFEQQPFDFFMVVDFGYLIPKWLLDLPSIAPLNIHPSDLPRWRGASPGQYVLLHGDPESAVTLMVMNEALDEGPVIAQLPFEVESRWTQTEYYQYAFDLICGQLGNLIEQFARGELKAQDQPKTSPTILADRLSKQESFRNWAAINQAMADGTGAIELERACRAYFPWPKLWTLVPTAQGEKRLIIHRCVLNSAGKLVLEQVQLEGKKITPWLEVKNTLFS